jgi:hypothetical protein
LDEEDGWIGFADGNWPECPHCRVLAGFWCSHVMDHRAINNSLMNRWAVVQITITREEICGMCCRWRWNSWPSWDCRHVSGYKYHHPLLLVITNDRAFNSDSL